MAGNTKQSRDTAILALRSLGCLTCNGSKLLCGHCGEPPSTCRCEEMDLMDCPDCVPEKWHMTAEQVGKAIGISPQKWKGRCHEIAALMLGKKLVKGELCYGHWHGHIDQSSHFSGRTLSHHGWIELPDGKIVDPTRWVFEAAEPYIFCGENAGEYDFGGNELQRSLMSDCPDFSYKNKFGHEAPVFDFSTLSSKAQSVIRRIAKSNGTKLGLDQVFWLANVPLDMLGSEAKAIYLWFVQQKKSAFIPIDNRTRVLGE